MGDNHMAGLLRQLATAGDSLEFAVFVDNGLDGRGRGASFASIVTLAFRRREMGQPALAALAAVVNFAASTPGILPSRPGAIP